MTFMGARLLLKNFVDSNLMDFKDNPPKSPFLPLTTTNGETSQSHKVSLNGCDKNKKMKADEILPFDFGKVSQQVYALVEIDNPLYEPVKHALEVIEESLNTYGTDGLALSFNGGKDCTVLLHLFSAALYKFIQKSAERIPKIQSVYITHQDPFLEVDAFVKESTIRYNLDLIKIEGPMKQALATYLEKRPSVQAILVGTRRNDPHGEHLSDFVPTDRGWPSFMRIHPILDWHYTQIWDFLMSLKVPYCTLYDAGYTSLGSTDNTRENPDLRNPDNPKGFDPAWKLTDESKERSGRSRKETYARNSQARKYPQYICIKQLALSISYCYYSLRYAADIRSALRLYGA
ncbi:hypothetical protein G9A89_004676 [Geosiphon pyriformis]|nr:hypothetical protein G9A89_004676 [Geosiphon pyriformis]